jgi:hypothetical protein
MINCASIEYQSNNIMIILGDERAMILKVNTSPYSENYGLNNTQCVYINTYYEGLTNNDIIEAIKTLCNNEDANYINYEVEAYLNSNLFETLKCND